MRQQPAPVASAPPEVIYIIRHGEKPAPGDPKEAPPPAPPFGVDYQAAWASVAEVLCQVLGEVADALASVWRSGEHALGVELAVRAVGIRPGHSRLHTRVYSGWR